MKLSRAEFRRRRRALMTGMEPGSIALLPAAREVFRNRDAEYPFRQDSDFYYLSGFTEPDALLVLAPGRRGERVIGFCRPRDPGMETWTGVRAGPDGLREMFGCDSAWRRRRNTALESFTPPRPERSAHPGRD